MKFFINFFSAVNFEYDSVIHGDLNIVKDLIQSNLCKVSQTKHCKGMSMKASHEIHDKGVNGVICNFDKNKRTREPEDSMNKHQVETYQ